MNKAQDNRELQSTDVVVIGSGIAGLFLALRCFREGRAEAYRNTVWCA